VTAVSTVTATFTVIPSYALTVSNLASGAGTVISSDGQINCGNSCSGDYISGTSVTLTASPNSVSNFVGWSGGNCIGTASTCTVDVSAAGTVTATFSSFGGEIAAWGDSLTFGNQDGTGTTYPGVLAQLTTRSVYNGGVSGESSTQIAARMLADTSRYGDLTIIWAGRNNSEDESAVLGDIASMVAVLPEPKHFLVLSILNACYEGNIESTAYSQIIGLNQALQAAYPNNYLDIRSLLVAQYDPSSPEDVSDHSIDVPPASLRFDNLHLNAAGYTFVAGQISRAIY
jgi:lysophospholipase L1-like esterase